MVALRRLDAIPSEPYPWLLGVARRVLANRRRTSRARRVLRLERPSEGEDPAVLVADADAMTVALRKLRPADREPLLLVAWEGLDARSAGAVLGCSAEAFAVRLHRARRRLQQAIDEVEDLQPQQDDTRKELS